MCSRTVVVELSIAVVGKVARELFTSHVCTPLWTHSLPFAFICVYGRAQNGIVKMLRAVIKSVKEISRDCRNATGEQGGIHGTGKVCYDKIPRIVPQMA